MNDTSPVDVCLVLEGTYPYTSGGVASWTHDLLHAQGHLTFHLVCLMAKNADLTPRYELPPNVKGITNVEVGGLPKGVARLPGTRDLMQRLEPSLRELQLNGGLRELAAITTLLAPLRARLGSSLLLDSPEAWDLLLRMYHTTHGDSAFIDYFWTWRTIMGGLYSILVAPIPHARIYHPLCTGYAGLFAARAHLETGRPVLLTEHGIYTNERRIEIAMAEWLYQVPSSGLRTDKAARDLKDLWIDAFTCYSRACYEAASRIVTLYADNQQLQLEDGADSEKLAVIPNAVDFERFSTAGARRSQHPPTVALIGRVAPIKDLKTYIRAIAILHNMIPGLHALVLGPVDEDPHYFSECQALANHLGLQDCLRFAGPVSVAEYLGRLDVVVLTSISEAQPLVILEAGSAGVPCVATDVGACREMILGDGRETDALGPAGEVVPLANPTATAQAIARLLRDRTQWERASRAIRERVRLYYNKHDLDRAYRELYDFWRSAEPRPRREEAA